MKVEDLPAEALAALADQVGDLRHDLGKYIGFETRFLGPDAETEALRVALRADLLATRRRGQRVESAVELWARLRPAELDGDPDVAVIDQAMVGLAAVSLEGDRGALDRAAALARQVSEATRRLDARTKART